MFTSNAGIVPMSHHTPLISMIVVGLVLAFVLGALAHRLRFSPLVGYLLAGVLVGPFTPGFVADQDIAAELAEIGVILLMFGVGLHFSLEGPAVGASHRHARRGRADRGRDRCSAWGSRWSLGWPIGAGLVFGLALSVASTVVLLRALAGAPAGRDRARPHRGRLADRRGPRDGAGAGAAAGAGRRCSKRRAPAAMPTSADRWPAARASRSARSRAFVAVMLIVGRA